jgi:hypothetical protein
MVAGRRAREATMEDFEKLGVFYLGRPWDLRGRRPGPGLLLYDAKDLVTHAVCIGMTGSGKTGLCLALLEEALLDGIPALIIDPKGDLADLLLTFPDLRPEDFAPWVDADEARKQGSSIEAFAAAQAERWKKGLAEWSQDGDRIRRLRDAADFVIYTPGSTVGVPVSVVRSFSAPGPAVRDDKDLLRERLTTTATSLLSLLGIQADPLRSREHILIATLLEAAWRNNGDLDLPTLIQRIQSPPVTRIGALELEAFYPAKDRFALAMQLNNLLASPGFDAWLEGEPLDVGAMLHGARGRPRAAIFSIAHLGDTERMFFVSLLLNETLGWMRAQTGTTSLRAILYMDELFGYLPPVANPPSKLPMLTLLKQARAFGVGLVLATQNPVDLDYKALSNAGTWFIGRLQTERDKARVLEGLEGAAAGAEHRFDRGRMEEVLAGLGNRIFLLNNVHDDAPTVFESRWAMSYLRGPLTRDQIKALMDPYKRAAAAGAKATAADVAAPQPSPVTARAGAAPSASRPVLGPGVPQFFLPVRGTSEDPLVYHGMVVGAASLRFVDARAGVDESQEVALLAPITDGAVPVSWDAATDARVSVSDLQNEPPAPGEYAPLPAAAGRAKSYEAWRKDLLAWLSANRRLELFRHPSSKTLSRPGESERDFRIRLGGATRQQLDAQREALAKKYAPRVAVLEERRRRAQQAVGREQEQATQQGLQAAISVGATLIGALFGRKTVSATTIGRATTAARGVGRVLKERQDVGRSEENVEAVEQQIAQLEAEFKAELAGLESRVNPVTDPLETVSLAPKRANVTVKTCALAWAPHRRHAGGDLTPAWG